MNISKDLRTRAKRYNRAIPTFLIYMWIRSSLMNLPIDFKKLGARYFYKYPRLQLRSSFLRIKSVYQIFKEYRRSDASTSFS